MLKEVFFFVPVVVPTRPRSPGVHLSVFIGYPLLDPRVMLCNSVVFHLCCRYLSVQLCRWTASLGACDSMGLTGKPAAMKKNI